MTKKTTDEALPILHSACEMPICKGLEAETHSVINGLVMCNHCVDEWTKWAYATAANVLKKHIMAIN